MCGSMALVPPQNGLQCVNAACRRRAAGPEYGTTAGPARPRRPAGARTAPVSSQQVADLPSAPKTAMRCSLLMRAAPAGA